MKNFILIFLFIGGTIAGCDNDSAEKRTNEMKRSTKKQMHRLDEKVCLESDAECLREKAKHRAEEGADYVEDKAEETVD